MGLSGDDELIKELEEKLDVKIKKVSVNAKFFIIDRKEILFYINKSSDEEDIAIWLNSEFFAESFASMFEIALK